MSRTTRKSDMDGHKSLEIYYKSQSWEHHEGDKSPWYDNRNRDGRLKETGRNRFYKELCRTYRRANDRMAINDYIANANEDAIFFDDRDCKKFIWSVW